MLLEMSYWRNSAEETFWVDNFGDFVKRNKKILNYKTDTQLDAFVKWLESKDYTVVYSTDTIVIDMPDQEYMLMYLSHETAV